ncbi:MAG: hypothetical protein KBF58_10900 [Methyloversatilis sp.]|nr:hypothetical protein [Methyloversatilis sp.]
MLVSLSNTELDAQRMEEAAVRAEKDAASRAEHVEIALEARCWREFQSALYAKETAQQEMLDLLRHRNNKYTADELRFVTDEGGTDIFVPLTQEKCAAAVAWLDDIFMTERPFDIKPSPIPELPAEIVAMIEQSAQMETAQVGPVVTDSLEAARSYVEQQKDRVLHDARQWACRRAERNTDRVEDELKKGGFYDALAEACDDAIGMRNGFLKGPFVRNRKVLTWAPDGRSATIARVPTRCFSAPSPLDMYPAPGLRDTNEAHVSERLRLTPNDLRDLIGVQGFRADRIEEALIEYGSDGLSGWWWSDVERADLEGRGMSTLLTEKGLFDVIEHYTFATGAELAEWGVPVEEAPVPAEVYSVVCWILGKSKLIGARLNDDPLGERPYFKFSFRRTRGAFWGQSVCDVIWPIQAMANAAVRNLINNMAQSAGYIQEVQVDRLAEGEEVRQIQGGAVIQTIQALNGAAGPAVYMHQPQINANVYMAIYEWASRLADALLGLPSFMSGVGPGNGAGTTSSGLAQLREMMARTFKFTVSDVDRAVLGIVKRTHTDLVLTEGAKNPDLVGDLQFDAKGSKSFEDRSAKQVRLNELVATTANPIDMEITGYEGRAELLRAAFKDFDTIDLDRTIPSREQMILKQKAKEAAAAAMGVDEEGNPLPGAEQAQAGQQPPQAAATQPDGSAKGDQGASQ